MKLINLQLSRKKTVIFFADWLVAKYLDWRAREHIARKRTAIATFAFDHITNRICTKGVSELHELKILFQILNIHSFPKRTAVDVGANIGNHSIFFAQQFDKVVAIEPNQDVFDLLSFNSRRHQNIVPICRGIGSKEGVMSIETQEQNSGGSTLIEASNCSMGRTIKMTTLDNLSQGLDNVDLIKMDVEGFEHEVIDGAKQTIRKYKPLIVFEQGLQKEADMNKLKQLFDELGYKQFGIVKVTPDLPFGRKDSRLSLLVNAFAQLIFKRTYSVEIGNDFAGRHHMVFAFPEVR